VNANACTVGPLVRLTNNNLPLVRCVLRLGHWRSLTWLTNVSSQYKPMKAAFRQGPPRRRLARARNRLVVSWRGGAARAGEPRSAFRPSLMRSTRCSAPIMRARNPQTRPSADHARSGLASASPPAEKTSARQNQARQSCTGDGTGNAHAATATRDSVVETEPSSAAHRFTKCNLDTVKTSQQWDADQVV
jgi:hypothetical protein